MMKKFAGLMMVVGMMAGLFSAMSYASTASCKKISGDRSKEVVNASIATPEVKKSSEAKSIR